MSANDRYDYGIVFYGVNGGTLPTYVDARGQTRRAIDLSVAGYHQMPVDYTSAYFTVGGARRYTLQVDIARIGGTFTVGLLGHFDSDPAADFGALATFRNDNQSTLALHPFAANGRYILQTANLGAVVQGAIKAQFAGSVDPASIIVRLRVER